MKNVKYLTRIYWSNEDEAYVAEVPDLPGCVSHGTTLPEAASNIQEAMELWLESAARHNDPIPEPDPIRARLSEIGSLLNISELSRRTGLKRTTVASKLKRKTPFTLEEARKINEALSY